MFNSTVSAAISRRRQLDRHGNAFRPFAVELRSAAQIHRRRHVPGLDGAADGRQAGRLGAVFVKAQQHRMHDLNIIQQGLGRGGEDDLDIGGTGLLAIHRGTDLCGDIPEALGQEFGNVRPHPQGYRT
jgi:hypothetical protein